MFNRYTTGLLTGLALFASAPSAMAQVPAPATEKIFLNVSIGGQFADRTLTSTSTKTVYDEPATLTSTLPIGAGAVIDVTAGYRIWHDIYAGLAITRYSNTSDAVYAATIPDALVSDKPHASSGTVNDLQRTEVGFNPFVLWVTPLMDKLDVAVGVGLSVIQLSQDSINDFVVASPTSVPTLVPTSESGTATGVYAAVDVIYSLTPRYGVGGFVRYAGGKADLPLAGETNVGGFHAGAGIRLRF